MKAKRKRHSAAFKAKVGFEALVGLKTVSQLAREYGVHPGQVTQWRATIRDHMPELFEPGKPVVFVDLKPAMREFLPRGALRQPPWASELMRGYWASG